MSFSRTKAIGPVLGLSVFVFALTGSAQADPLTLTPKDAIFQAADAAPAPVPGTFVMTVKSAGSQDGNIYLNSELDYRDQRNLSIEVCPAAIEPLTAKFGGDLETVLVGKNVMVSGDALRTKITFTINNKPTEKYYYQTHVGVCSAEQISLQTP